MRPFWEGFLRGFVLAGCVMVAVFGILLPTIAAVALATTLPFPINTLLVLSGVMVSCGVAFVGAFEVTR